MNNFIFENKTKVYFGKGCVGEYLPKIAAVHGDKVLLAYGGGSIKKNGVYEEVIDCVQKNCLGTGVDCHDDLNDNEKQIPVQGDRHGFFFSFLCFSSYVHRIPPFLTVRKSR